MQLFLYPKYQDYVKQTFARLRTYTNKTSKNGNEANSDKSPWFRQLVICESGFVGDGVHFCQP